MILFLAFMWLVDFINFKQLLIIGIFEGLCILWRKWEKDNVN